MLQPLPISQSLHHVLSKQQHFQLSAFPQLRDASLSDRSEGALTAHPRMHHPQEAPQLPHSLCCNICCPLQWASRVGEQRTNTACVFISGNSTDWHICMLKSKQGLNFFPLFLCFFSSWMSLSMFQWLLFWGLHKGCAPEGPSWSLARSTPTFLAGGRQMSPCSFYLHNLPYISIEGQWALT